MSTTPVYWKNVPKKSVIVFLPGVFLLFSIIGFASDIPEMGRQQRMRFVLKVLIVGIFPVFYAQDSCCGSSGGRRFDRSLRCISCC